MTQIGIFTRCLTDGGNQERLLAERYKGMTALSPCGAFTNSVSTPWRANSSISRTWYAYFTFRRSGAGGQEYHGETGTLSQVDSVRLKQCNIQEFAPVFGVIRSHGVTP
jgi:hypothetical protein